MRTPPLVQERHWWDVAKKSSEYVVEGKPTQLQQSAAHYWRLNPFFGVDTKKSIDTKKKVGRLGPFP